MGHSIEQVANVARDTAALFTGGTSGVNVAQGKAPTEQTLMTDASGLAAGAGLAGAGLGGTAAGGSASGAAGSGGGPLGSVLYPQASTVPGSGISLGGTSVGAGSLVNYADPGVQALLSAAAPYESGAYTGGVQGAGSATEGGSSGATNAARAASPVGPGGAGPGAGGGTAPAVTGAQGDHGGMVDQILKGMKNNAGLAQLGLSGVGLAMAAQRPKMPNQDQLNALGAAGSQAAQELISSYRSGQLSGAQQASLDQLTRGTKNQINQYFASIGQSDSTAHMQALAQVDQQALGMKQQMLDNMLQQGLQAIGVAQGPLGTIANYQVQQDKNLLNALNNFAGAAGGAFGRQAGTETQPKSATGQTASSGMLPGPGQSSPATGSGVGTTTQSFDR